jgi:hypothetical protein
MGNKFNKIHMSKDNNQSEFLPSKKNPKNPLKDDPAPFSITRKVSEPVGKNKKKGHPKKNSGYAEDQPNRSMNKKMK